MLTNTYLLALGSTYFVQFSMPFGAFLAFFIFIIFVCAASYAVGASSVVPFAAFISIPLFLLPLFGLMVQNMQFFSSVQAIENTFGVSTACENRASYTGGQVEICPDRDFGELTMLLTTFGLFESWLSWWEIVTCKRHVNGVKRMLHQCGCAKGELAGNGDVDNFELCNPITNR